MDALSSSIPPSGPIEDKHQDNGRLKKVMTEIPDEILLLVFSSCPKECRYTFSLVCWRWNHIAYDDALWDNKSLFLSFKRLFLRESEKMQTAEWKTTKENVKKACQNNKSLKLTSEQATQAVYDTRENRAAPNTNFKIIGNQCVWLGSAKYSAHYKLHCWDLEDLSKEEVTKEGFAATLGQYSETKFFFREFFQSNGYTRIGDEKGLYDIQTKEWQELSEAKSLIFFEKKSNLYLTIACTQKFGPWKVSLTNADAQTFKEMDYDSPNEATLIWNSNFLVIKGWRFQKDVKNYILDIFEIKKTDAFTKLGTLVLDKLDNAVINSIPNFELSGSIIFISTYAQKKSDEFNAVKSLEGRFWVLSDKIVEGPRVTFYEKSYRMPFATEKIDEISLINDLFFTIKHTHENEKLTSLKSVISVYDLKQVISSKVFSTVPAVGTLTLKGHVTRMHVFKPDAFLFVNYVKAPGVGYGMLSETLQLYHVPTTSSSGKRKNSETQKTTKVKKQKPFGN